MRRTLRAAQARWAAGCPARVLPTRFAGQGHRRSGDTSAVAQASHPPLASRSKYLIQDVGTMGMNELTGLTLAGPTRWLVPNFSVCERFVAVWPWYNHQYRSQRLG